MGTGFSPPQSGIPHARGIRSTRWHSAGGNPIPVSFFCRVTSPPFLIKLQAYKGAWEHAFLFFLKSVTLYAERFVAE